MTPVTRLLGWRIGRLASGAVLMLMVAGCAAQRGPAARFTTLETAPPPPESWPAAYTDAIEDALNPDPSKVVHDLTAIVPSNPNLVWRTIDGEQHVLTASLVGDTTFYTPFLGGPYDTGDHYIWITAVPDLVELCGEPGFGGGDLLARLRQLVGLTPTDPIVAAVELWVRPQDLFRPAADNEITDSTAGLDIPDDAEPWYRQWFNALRSKQYFQSEDPPHNAYPWTQLGYTYDWGNPDAPRGLSEFVIKTGARVRVESITPPERYCAAGSG